MHQKLGQHRQGRSADHGHLPPPTSKPQGGSARRLAAHVAPSPADSSPPALAEGERGGHGARRLIRTSASPSRHDSPRTATTAARPAGAGRARSRGSLERLGRSRRSSPRPLRPGPAWPPLTAPAAPRRAIGVSRAPPAAQSRACAGGRGGAGLPVLG